MYRLARAVATGIIAGNTSYPEALGNGPKMKIYSGTPPADADAALAGNTLIATLSPSATPIASSSDVGGKIRAVWAAIASAVAGATLTATFFRDETAGGVVVGQGTIGLSGSGEDLILSSVTISAGSTVSCASRSSDMPY